MLVQPKPTPPLLFATIILIGLHLGVRRSSGKVIQALIEVKPEAARFEFNSSDLA
jgi:hypothetical protein